MLKDLKELKPKSFVTQDGNCNYNTQFWFVNGDKYQYSKYRISITWRNSPLYEDEKIVDKSSIYTTETEERYKKYIIQDFEILDGGFYLTHSTTKYIDSETSPSLYLRGYLKNQNGAFRNKSLFYFICGLSPLKITKLKNIQIKNNYCYQTEFTIVNPYNNKKVKIVVDWQNGIALDLIKTYKRINGNSFSDLKRNFYADEIIKDIVVCQ
ncbi:hypothetical protein [Chryseobacterium zhengzhouense]|uniref:hypothetical protein n=1 Tax=Chryseobacterium zhengzhouense TaxID=1636086 RepID=UPI003671A308